MLDIVFVQDAHTRTCDVEREKGKAIFVGDTMERAKKFIIETREIAQLVKVLAVKVPGTQIEANCNS